MRGGLDRDRTGEQARKPAEPAIPHHQEPGVLGLRDQHLLRRAGHGRGADGHVRRLLPRDIGTGVQPARNLFANVHPVFPRQGQTGRTRQHGLGGRVRIDDPQAGPAPRRFPGRPASGIPRDRRAIDSHDYRSAVHPDLPVLSPPHQGGPARADALTGGARLGGRPFSGSAPPRGQLVPRPGTSTDRRGAVLPKPDPPGCSRTSARSSERDDRIRRPRR